jgi:hypothetical protein
MDCEFTETKFENSNLDPILLMNVKFCKSNKCSEIKESSSFDFEKLLKDMNLIYTDVE